MMGVPKPRATRGRKAEVGGQVAIRRLKATLLLRKCTRAQMSTKSTKLDPLGLEPFQTPLEIHRSLVPSLVSSCRLA